MPKPVDRRQEKLAAIIADSIATHGRTAQNLAYLVAGDLLELAAVQVLDLARLRGIEDIAKMVVDAAFRTGYPTPDGDYEGGLLDRLQAAVEAGGEAG